MVRGPTPPTTKPSSSGGCLALILIVGLLVLIGQCTAKKDAGSSLGNVSTADMNAADGMAAAPAPTGTPSSAAAVEPLDVKAVAGAVRQERAVVSAQGLSGAMIFSQNCYDALGRGFSWSRLDECGAFDAVAAARLTDDDAAAFEKEAGYFDGETAAGRFLAAATGAGEDAGAADERWSRLQAKARPRSLPGKSEASGVDQVDAGVPTAAEQVAADDDAPH